MGELRLAFCVPEKRTASSTYFRPERGGAIIFEVAEGIGHWGKVKG